MKKQLFLMILASFLFVACKNPFEAETIYVKVPSVTFVTNDVLYRADLTTPSVNLSFYEHKQGYLSIYHSAFSTNNFDYIFEKCEKFLSAYEQIGFNNVPNYIIEEGVLSIPDPQTNLFMNYKIRIIVVYKRKVVTVYE